MNKLSLNEVAQVTGAEINSPFPIAFRGLADAGDIVLILGKGHENYQILGTGKIHFDDREIALEAIKNG